MLDITNIKVINRKPKTKRNKHKSNYKLYSTHAIEYFENCIRTNIINVFPWASRMQLLGKFLWENL